MKLLQLWQNESLTELKKKIKWSREDISLGKKMTGGQTKKVDKLEDEET